jgi:hypothetical protein
MAWIPGEASPPPSLNKTDIIAQHITAAVQLLAIGANPYSTHLIVMAAEEMILQVAKARNIVLYADYRFYTKEVRWRRHGQRDTCVRVLKRFADRGDDCRLQSS